MKDLFTEDIKYLLFMIVLVCAFIFGVPGCVNGCSSREWNDGICPKCNEHYELRGASQYIKYYVCPECHAEVERI